MREGFVHSKFAMNKTIESVKLAGKPKALEQILKERGLWDRGYYTSCPKSDGRPG